MNRGPSGFPGAIPLRTAIPGHFYAAGATGTQPGTNGTITLDRLFALPFEILGRWDRIDANQLGVASSFLRMGIFADGGNRPDELMFDFGQVSMSGSGPAFIPVSFENTARIWISGVGQGVAPSTSRLGNPPVNNNVGTTDHYSLGFTGGAFYVDGISGTLPKRWPSIANIIVAANLIPMMWLRSY